MNHIFPFKNREIDMNSPVDVYLNLTKTRGDGKRWYSIRQNGKVVAHSDALQLEDVDFIVNKSGQERVRKEGRKNVHAFLRGKIAPGQTKFISGNVTYNPYHDDYFKVDGFHVSSAEKVSIWHNRIFAYEVYPMRSAS